MFESTPDETWIRRFAKDSGNAIITADRMILRRPHQIAAITENNLIAFFLPDRWATSPKKIQAAQLIYWWQKIEETLSKSPPKQCWLVPFGFGNSEIRQETIDHRKIRKALKKQSKIS